jgi:hypothetical protein
MAHVWETPDDMAVACAAIAEGETRHVRATARKQKPAREAFRNLRDLAMLHILSR